MEELPARTKEERLSAYMSAVYIAYADNEIHPSEIEILSKMSIMYGLPEDECRTMMRGIIPNVKYIIPEKMADRIYDFCWLLMLAKADGLVTISEMIPLTEYAKVRGISPSIIEDISLKLLGGSTPEEISSKY
jgi:hypothetical protein